MPDKRYLKKLEYLSETIVEAYNNGMTLQHIASLYDCSQGTIRNLLISNDVPRRKRGRKQNAQEEEK